MQHNVQEAFNTDRDQRNDFDLEEIWSISSLIFSFYFTSYLVSYYATYAHPHPVHTQTKNNLLEKPKIP